MADGQDGLSQAVEEWRLRLLNAESRRAAVRRRLRLCQRALHRTRSNLTVLGADLDELEQQASSALETQDGGMARDLSLRIGKGDAALQDLGRRQQRLINRKRRLELLLRCWEWRAEQHRRSGTMYDGRSDRVSRRHSRAGQASLWR